MHVLYLGGAVAAELGEEVAEEGRVGHHCDALLGPFVEPLEERDGSLPAALGGLAHWRVEDVLVLLNLEEL